MYLDPTFYLPNSDLIYLHQFYHQVLSIQLNAI